MEASPPAFRRELEEYLASLQIGSVAWDECFLLGALYHFRDVSPEELWALHEGVVRKNRVTAEALWRHFQGSAGLLAVRTEAQVGIEYRLRFSAPDAEAVAAVLRRLPTVSEAPPPAHRLDVGAADSNWPQATVQIEPGGAYFCDHCGGAGRALLGEVVARLVSAFGAVTVDEL